MSHMNLFAVNLRLILGATWWELIEKSCEECFTLDLVLLIVLEENIERFGDNALRKVLAIINQEHGSNVLSICGYKHFLQERDVDFKFTVAIPLEIWQFIKLWFCTWFAACSSLLCRILSSNLGILSLIVRQYISLQIVGVSLRLLGFVILSARELLSENFDPEDDGLQDAFDIHNLKLFS